MHHLPSVKGSSLLRGSLHRLMFLAPATSSKLNDFNRVETDKPLFHARLGETQRLRDSVYQRLGAAAPSVSAEARRAQIDQESWHLLALDDTGQVCGCMRYHEHLGETGFSHLHLSQSVLAQCSRWGSPLKRAVEAELNLARLLDLPYVEVGGWALLESLHGTGLAVAMALVMYALSRRLGGAMGITTANNANCAASLLRRIGGRCLESEDGKFPSYHDPHYRCEIEILRFYSWSPNPRYAGHIEDLEAEVLRMPVLTCGSAARNRLAAPPLAFGAAAGHTGHTGSGANNRYLSSGVFGMVSFSNGSDRGNAVAEITPEVLSKAAAL
jgi:hypothetical protein